MAKKKLKLGDLIDECYGLRAERLALEKKVDLLKEEQRALEDQINEQLQAQGITSGRGDSATATRTENEVPRVADWDLFHKYILEEGDLSLLERRPSKAACRERWESDEDVPGVEKFTVVGLSLTKVGEGK